jgi:hypothetical protein
VSHEEPPASLVSEGEATPPPGSDDEDEADVQLRLLVSSQHLKLASPVFRELLKESAPKKTLHVKGWNPEALLIVMDVIHGHHHEVPRSVSLKTLVDIAFIVVHYQLQEIVEVFGQIWLPNLEEAFPTSHGKESIVFLFLAWVFSAKGLFKKMSELAVLNSEGPLDTMGLPIPESVLSELNSSKGASA